MSQDKSEIITFKADPVLAERLKTLPNRSSFIRQALFDALENTCPLCRGTGTITDCQKPNLENFFKSHHLDECRVCHSPHINCDKGK